MLRILKWLIIAILLQFAVAENRNYIIVMKDETSTADMEVMMTAMHQMSCPLDADGNVVEPCDNGEYRQTNELMKTITGPMSEEAVEMARNMNSVSYVEEDQVVTRADASIDFTDPTEYPQPHYYELLEGSLSAQTETSASGTSRYNLDAIDEGCGDCNNGRYEPEGNGEGVDIYILDTGIENRHREFGGRAQYGGYDAVDDLERTSMRGRDCHGHGTHCAAIAAGYTSGVAKNANLYSVRVLNCNSFGSYTGILRALDYVLQRHRSKLAL
eukprot:TRINITY_DN3729_c0_g1_i6.p1 TRINITY_DN3729_c0_g1~~TRINITY_DN3729_c0_g1_i6.p1  ORF type:complete len:271 (-),score=54.13 TRINITY_DN3729_c0_g1_i6:144-956(-)